MTQFQTDAESWLHQITDSSGSACKVSCSDKTTSGASITAQIIVEGDQWRSCQNMIQKVVLPLAAVEGFSIYIVSNAHRDNQIQIGTYFESPVVMCPPSKNIMRFHFCKLL